MKQESRILTTLTIAVLAATMVTMGLTKSTIAFAQVPTFSGISKIIAKSGTQTIVVNVTSLKGEKGDTGAVGAPGSPGSPGKDGRDGVNGTNGINGKDGITTFFFCGPNDTRTVCQNPPTNGTNPTPTPIPIPPPTNSTNTNSTNTNTTTTTTSTHAHHHK